MSTLTASPAMKARLVKAAIPAPRHAVHKSATVAGFRRFRALQ